MAVVDELILKITIQNDGAGSFKDLIADAQNLSEESQSMFSGMTSAVTDFALSVSSRATSALVDMGITGVKKLAEFEAEMAGVSKTTGMVGEDLDSLGKTLRDMSIGDLGGAVAAEELAQIAAAAGQLGVKGDDIESFTKAVAEISTATDIAADRTAEDMAKIANQFREGLEKPRIYFDEFGNSLGETSKSAYQQLSNIGSAINELSNNTTASAATLVDMTKRMAGMGSSVGLTVDQVAALGATMTDAGLGVERGSTAMNKMLGELYKNTESFAAGLKLSSTDLADALQKDPMKAIEMVLQGMDKMKQEEGPKALLLAVEQLLGKGDGITQLALNLSTKYADLGKNADMAADAFMKGTSAHEEFLSQTGHTEARWGALSEKMNEFYRRVGEVLEPMTKWVTEALNSLADMALANFDKIAGYAQTGIDAVKEILGGLFGEDVMAAFSGGQIVEGLQLMYQQVSEYLEANPFFQMLVSGAELAVESISTAFATISEIVANVMSALSAGDFAGVFDALLSGVRSTVAAIEGLFQSLLTKVQESITGFASLFEGTPLEPFVNEIAELLNHVIDVVKVLMETGSELFGTIFTPAVIEGTIGVLVAALGTAAGWINDLIEGIQHFGTLLGEYFAGDIGLGDLFAGIAEQLSNLIGEIAGVIAEALGNVLSGVAALFGLDTLGALLWAPFAWLGEQIGSLGEILLSPFTALKDFLAGLWEGVSFETLTTAFMEVITGIQSGFTDCISWIGEQFGSVGDLILSPFESVGSAIVDTMKAAFELLWEWMKEKFSGLSDLVMGPIQSIKEKVSGALSSVSSAVSGLFDDEQEAVQQVTQEVDKLTTATNNATEAVSALGVEALYQSVFPDLIDALKVSQSQTDALTGSILDTTVAVNKLGVDAIYQSVFPDFAEAVSYSARQSDTLTDSIKKTYDAAYKLGGINPVQGWESSLKSVSSQISSLKGDMGTIATSSGSRESHSSSPGSRLSTSAVSDAVASSLGSISNNSVVDRSVTVQFVGTNVVDESSKSRFAREIASTISTIGSRTIRG